MNGIVMKRNSFIVRGAGNRSYEGKWEMFPRKRVMVHEEHCIFYFFYFCLFSLVVYDMRKLLEATYGRPHHQMCSSTTPASISIELCLNSVTGPPTHSFHVRRRLFCFCFCFAFILLPPLLRIGFIYHRDDVGRGRIPRTAPPCLV